MIREIIRIALLIVSVGLFASGVFLSYRDQTGSASVTYLAAILALAFVFLSQFKRFKGLGFEGELWENKMEEAEQLIGRLRNIIAALAEPTIQLATRSGRWDSAFSPRERQQLVRRIRQLFLENGIDEALIAGAVRDHHRITIIDLAEPLRKLGHNLQTRLSGRLEAEARALRENPPRGENTDMAIAQRRTRLQEWRNSFDQAPGTAPHERLADRLLEMLNQCPEATEAERQEAVQQAHEAIEDIRYYVAHHELRRPDVGIED